MKNSKTMLIDGMPVLIENEKNILELIRKVGIDLPTFCYYSELSTYGACRMCVVENKWGDVEASCSTVPAEGMEVFTNTPKLRKYRKMVLELLLSAHCRDCTTCDKNGNCKLQELAHRFGVTQVRFSNTKENPMLDCSSLSITRDMSKCILCGDCVRVCEEVQNVGAIDFAHRGSDMMVTPAFGEPIAHSNCVGCGQCSAVCPTGAIVIKNDVERVWKALSDKKNKVVVQVAPAVRVGIGQIFGLPVENSMGKIVAALRRLGFDSVFDTTTGADLTVLEETAEFLSRLEHPEKLPLFTSCCPAWVRYAEEKHPELLNNLSTCRSPMQMFGAVLKEHFSYEDKNIISVAVMPCTAKKSEAGRDEFVDKDGKAATDFVLTTQELAQMIKEAGIVFTELSPEVVDQPFGAASGAGVIFGVTGGVTEAVVRRVSDDKSNAGLRILEFKGVRGFEGLKEMVVPAGDAEIKIAVVSGLANAEKLIRDMKSGERSYHFIEVMACPGGCVAGAGQPFAKTDVKKKRGEGLYEADRMSVLKRSEENPIVVSLYSGVLKGRVHELLHRTYVDKRAK